MNRGVEHPVRNQAARISRIVVSRADLPASALRPYLMPADLPAMESTGRRLLNVAIAFLTLLLIAPFLLVIAVLVRLSSRGPIIFTQTRVGIDRRGYRSGGGDSRRKVDYGGRPFRMYKFRTMRPNPDAELQIWADPNDRRVTALGRVLRKYRIDELPQLVNVLKGEMNVVGPRPEQPKIFNSLNREISGYARRQRVLPGITGWAQINQHYDRCIEDVKRKLAYDLEYIERQSSWQDLIILLRTIPVVLTKRGAW
jgi:lipopolysaccharide/colanic/teichoic acid biosynthesis glycosyltransferase